jgi:hypothetical protein
MIDRGIDLPENNNGPLFPVDGNITNLAAQQNRKRIKVVADRKDEAESGCLSIQHKHKQTWIVMSAK